MTSGEEMEAVRSLARKEYLDLLKAEERGFRDIRDLVEDDKELLFFSVKERGKILKGRKMAHGTPCGSDAGLLPCDDQKGQNM